MVNYNGEPIGGAGGVGPALATSAAVAELLGRALTADEGARIDRLLLDASSTIRAYTNQRITEETSTSIFRVNNRRIRLPQQAVTIVSAVEDLHGNDLVYTWYAGDQFISLASAGYLNEFELNLPAGSALGRARVTYTHGYAVIPDDIIGICAQVAARALGTQPTDATESETIAGYGYTRDAAARGGATVLLDGEMRILNRYRLNAQPIPML